MSKKNNPKFSRIEYDINPVRHIDQLESIKEEWITVHKESRLQSPLLSFEYIQLWYTCFALPDQVRVYIAFDEETAIGFLPLILCREKGVRILKGLSSDHCCHCAPLYRKEDESHFPELILNALQKDRRAWDVLNFNFLYSFTECPDLFSDSLLDNLGVHWNKIIRPTYTVFFANPFDDYIRNDLSANFRRLLKQSTKRLKKAGNYRFKHYQGEDALQLWHEFVRIEDSGWKGALNSSIKKTEAIVKKYYEDFLKILSDKNALRIYFLELNEDRIACVFGYFQGDTYHCEKAGYDEKYKKLSPSNLLFIHMVEHLMADFPHVKRIHLFPWSYGYKDRLINEESNYLETIVFSNNLRGFLMRVAYSLKEKRKKIINRLKPNREGSREGYRIWTSN